jgi:cation diffusion facilitator CzcD-associated flavoprotein CzcO
MLEEMGTIPTMRYASGEEIRLHLDAIAAKYRLGDDALFHTDVETTTWDDTAARWVIRTDHGDELRAKYVVMCVGILNLPKVPALPGMEDFTGTSFHTARWSYAYTGGSPTDPALANLADKTVAVVGTGGSGIQCVPPLGRSAQHVYVFQRTPSAVGVRGNRPTEPDFSGRLAPGWQRRRMDNFQAVMLGRAIDEDLTDDGWTQHYAAVHNAPRWKGMTSAEYMLNAETIDFGIMEEHRNRVAEIVADPATAEILKPYYRYLCKRPCFHDEYLQAFNEPNVTLVDCPGGIDRITEEGVVVGGRLHDVDCIVYGTGFEPEVTPLARRAGHEIVGRGGIRLADKWADGPATLFGMMSRGFPNLFVMPAPAQQAVVTVNYTQLAVLGAEFVSGAVGLLEKKGVRAFDVADEAEAEWTQRIIESFVDPSHVMSACTPSRINNEGNPQGMNPKMANYGRGFGDFFAYRDLLEQWLERGDFEGLELDV